MGSPRLTAARERAGSFARHAAKVVERAIADFFNDRCPQLAASISYYALFAIFPVAILAVTAFSVVLGEDAARRDVIDFMTRQLPVTEDAGRQDIADLIDGVVGNTETFRVVGAVGLVISASGLMAAVRNGLNTAWDVDERRPPLRGKLIDILLVLGIGGVITTSFVATVTREATGDAAEDAVEPIATLLSLLATTGGRLFPTAIAFAVFAFLYRFVTACPVRWSDALVGAAVTAVGYEAAKLGFGYYLDSIANYGAVYGSLGAVVAFVFFVFLVANILLLGAEVAAERPRVAAGRYEGGPPDERPFGRKVADMLRSLVVDDSEPVSRGRRD